MEDVTYLDKEDVPGLLKITNFKKFPYFEIPLEKSLLVFCGPNGSGKTQLLWGILIFCRAYNLKVSSKFKEFNVTPHLSKLLCNSAYHNLPSYASFANEMKENGHVEVQFKTVFEKSRVELQFTLDVNGSAIFSPVYGGITPVSMISFGFLASTFQFYLPDEEEVGVKDIITSYSKNIRLLYSNLTKEAQSYISTSMGELFGVLRIEQEGHGSYAINITEANSFETEIMFCGSAMQKVFVGFVLLETVLQSSHPLKLFLIEDIETLLYPSLVRAFFTLIQGRTNSGNVKLFITTHSRDILDSVDQNNICLLGLDD